MLRRMTNYHNSVTHRLPPEILTAVASHFGRDHRFLILFTHVCHHWRSTLIFCPRLWSHIEFENEGRALAFVERSKSVPVSANLVDDSPSKVVMESLTTIANRLITLRGTHGTFLSGLLAQPLPLLRNLDIVETIYQPAGQSMPRLPSVRSLVTRDVAFSLFHVRNLTNFRFELSRHSAVPSRLGERFLAFFRSCPKLEVVFLSYDSYTDGIEFTNKTPTDTVSLPRLRSFTHEAPPHAGIGLGLFNSLSLPLTCDVAFTTGTKCQFHPNKRWTDVFPTPRNPSYFSNVKTVKTMSCFQNTPTVFRVEFLNSQNTRISFTRNSSFGRTSIHPCNSNAFTKLLDFLRSSGIADSIETLHFERYPTPLQHGSTPMYLAKELLKFGNLETLVLWQCDLIIFLVNPPAPDVWCPAVRKLVVCLPPLENSWEPTEVDILRLMRRVAVSRQRHGTPLETITMFSRDIKQLLRGCEREIGELRSCVGLVEIVKLDGWRGVPS